MLKYDATRSVWREGCGCSGKPQTDATLPADSVRAVFTVPVAQYLDANGNRYHAKPGMVAVDVRGDDLGVLTANGKARAATDEELVRLTGYRSR